MANKRTCILPLIALVSLITFNPVQSATDPYFMGLGDLPGSSFNSITADISADGTTVVGCSWSAVGFQAFRWTQETGMVGLGDLPGGAFSSCAQAVSGDGEVVVGMSTSANGQQEAFRWTSQTGMVGLGDLPGGGFFSRARGISVDGKVIVGESFSALRSDDAFRWTEQDGMVSLGEEQGGFSRTIATDTTFNGSVVVGLGLGSNGWEAFKWSRQGKKKSIFEALGDLPGGDFSSSAGAISADGMVIAGDGRTESSTTQAARWIAGAGWIALGDLPGGEVWGRCSDISDDGSLIVGWSTSAAGNEAFIWDEVGGMKRLHDVLASDLGIEFPGWTLISAEGISADGSVVAGDGTNPQGFRESWIARLVSDPGGPGDPIPVVILIKPDSVGEVTINLKSEKTLPVGVLSDDTFDAAQTDLTTVRFGPTGAEGRPIDSSVEDLDGDSDADLLLTFGVRSTRISCGDTSATLTGDTYTGESFTGTDTFTVVCP